MNIKLLKVVKTQFLTEYDYLIERAKQLGINKYTFIRTLVEVLSFYFELRRVRERKSLPLYLLGREVGR